MSAMQFLHALSELSISNTERAVALLWWHGLEEATACRTAAELASEMEAAGYAKQNVSRLRTGLAAHRYTAKASNGAFKIAISGRRALDDAYGELATHRKPRKSSAVLPGELFAGTRGYIEKVVAQLNASYEFGLFDCCAVMCRRLLETLIIEAYDTLGASEQLKGTDGHFLMLSGLLAKVENGSAVSLSRNGLQGLKDFKHLGDLSAHNRRFNARKNDIDRVRDGLRVVTEELVKIAHPAH